MKFEHQMKNPQIIEELLKRMLTPA